MTVCTINAIQMNLHASMILFILPQDDETALHIAAYHGHVEVVKVLTEKKDRFVVNARDKVSM